MLQSHAMHGRLVEKEPVRSSFAFNIVPPPVNTINRAFWIVDIRGNRLELLLQECRMAEMGRKATIGRQLPANCGRSPGTGSPARNDSPVCFPWRRAAGQARVIGDRTV